MSSISWDFSKLQKKNEKEKKNVSTKTNIWSYISQDEVSKAMKHSQWGRSSEGIHSCGLLKYLIALISHSLVILAEASDINRQVNN